MLSFLAIRPEMRSVELGHIWYVPKAQGMGINTEAVYLMLREAFEQGYRRVEWKCDSLNARSRHVAEKLGFTFEGVFRQHMIVKGRNRDTAWFSMLDGEWPRARESLEEALQWK
jgi:RimJ/RimL family protein N-acetyltransferase